ncbi:MAG: 30S ribosomal protein S1 [Phenylobacterium sp.]|jgi:small subunit ribosomal protein S1|uniref:30S ribosomal protein S1 n=1 Tax=Phenylobacterium sp. TaxID=1871053 RepID=UPI0025FE034A|nr:30S ribosomal protein S1 [Phenylobacterium sp.]MCA3712622.1 30S ribosomal protein S1 [Phenylobacterium sp.]MCA3715362.1 30S ribosomal protein S1 [Phenylobacterium sp.]MCA3726544.1 30S ribosomal protein S1 [Phenylobacterium sp.]MCA3729058.1 30S ribosomal protein S1 [Phenylobacterium sp.]MCA3732670.1 30S ribosomal protein S1 [Phenylobacterium sp.]
MADDAGLNPSRDDFATLLNESLGGRDFMEGQVVKGTIVGLEKDFAIIDVGLKTEGRVSIKEFGAGDEGKPQLAVGDTVEVFLERVENALGEAVISREKARREEAWTRLEGVHARNEPVMGAIVGRVKGGFTVDLGGASAFLPGSQVDIRPVRDVGPLMGKEQPFAILKMDRPRGNIVVSRRAILEEARAEQRTELVGQLQEGEIREGVVKNITDYGAFVDLGGIDGLLHVTDMSWKRVNHPSQVLAVGDTVRVQIVKINPDTQRISLGMKQLQSDPWDGVEAKYPMGARLTGRITNITDYGAFVELEAGVEGLVHVSEMSWTKKNVHPGKIVSTSQEVDVVVLDVDPSKRRVSLGLKQAMDNPWEAFLAAHPVGSTVEGEVKNATEFGLFLGLDNDIDGMVHLSDIDWNVPGEEAITRYHKGEMVKARVLDVDVEKERISLGIKQLAGDPMSGDAFRKGQTVTVTVTEVTSGGIEVRFGEDDAPMSAFIRKSDLSRDRADQRPERFAVGDRVDAQITLVDKAARRVSLSIKALEMVEEKEAIEKFGSSDSGASLGDILGAALREKAQKD